MLGCARTGLEYKFQRMAWSLRLELHSHVALAQVFCDTIVMLKDAGTERGLTRIQPVAASQVLPHFDFDSGRAAQNPRRGARVRQYDAEHGHGRGRPPRQGVFDEDWPEDGTESESECGDCLLDPGNSLSIDGPLHMLHNTTKDLEKLWATTPRQ